METTLLHEITATAIPAGNTATLPAGLPVYIVQTLGGNVTVRTELGLFRISEDATGALRDYQPRSEEAKAPSSDAGAFGEAQVWAALKTCFDPEIPVNIVDLGLIYDLAIEPVDGGKHRVEVKMTLTAPGCGMGPVIAEDARKKIVALPGVDSAQVHIVWDPIWGPQMISPDGRKALGLE